MKATPAGCAAALILIVLIIAGAVACGLAAASYSDHVCSRPDAPQACQG